LNVQARPSGLASQLSARAGERAVEHDRVGRARKDERAAGLRLLAGCRHAALIVTAAATCGNERESEREDGE